MLGGRNLGDAGPQVSAFGFEFGPEEEKQGNESTELLHGGT